MSSAYDPPLDQVETERPPSPAASESHQPPLPEQSSPHAKRQGLYSQLHDSSGGDIGNVEKVPISKTLYPRSRFTMVVCYFMLLASVSFGATMFFIGVLSDKINEPVKLVISTVQSQVGQTLSFDENSRDAVSLLFTILVAVFTEALGFIHGTCLKWTLLKEDRLEFNSNLRLVSRARRSRPNSWMFNTLYMVALAVSYATTPMLVIYRSTATDTYPEFTKAAPTVLGIAILLQCAICIWCLAVTSIPSWNSSPLVAAFIASTRDKYDMERTVMQNRYGRGMASFYESKRNPAGELPMTPKPRQVAAIFTRAQAVCSLFLSYFSFAGLLTWFIITAVVIKKDTDNGTSKSYDWTFFPNENTPSLTIKSFNSTESSIPPMATLETNNSSVLISIMLAASVQLFITIGTHFAESQVLLCRDEDIWRKATTEDGCAQKYNSLLAPFTNPCSFVLLLLKISLHWIYGLAIYYDYTTLRMNLPQLLYLTLFWLALTFMTTYLSLRRPKGKLPATYGHLQTLVDIVDEWDWSSNIFWGHKGHIVEDTGQMFYHAGTKNVELPPVRLDLVYK
ncbi:hypothetical protein V1525DRAFT_407388 [Lipomyces kononenkoae]|uniref:Uncharacterized protein n=1 Tax=Lipomyces kononenkoae TaxID=34357 RepID=A0ACC3SXD2_LIPKO